MAQKTEAGLCVSKGINSSLVSDTNTLAPISATTSITIATTAAAISPCKKALAWEAPSELLIPGSDFMRHAGAEGWLPGLPSQVLTQLLWWETVDVWMDADVLQFFTATRAQKWDFL